MNKELSGPGKVTITHSDNRLISLTVTDEHGNERFLNEGALTWYNVRPTIQDFLAGHPVTLFGHLALAESLSGTSRRNTLESIFSDQHDDVFRAYKVLVHNCLTEKGFHIPGGALASDKYTNEVLIARPTGEKAINIAAIYEAFAEWTNAEIANRILTGIQSDVYSFLFNDSGNRDRGCGVCQLVTVLFLIEGTFTGTRNTSNVANRYRAIFGEIFPDELPSGLDLAYGKDEVLELCYKLRNSLKSLTIPKEIDLSFENSDFVFEIPIRQHHDNRLVIYVENFYRHLVAHVMRWEEEHRNNPDYMPNRIIKSFASYG